MKEDIIGKLGKNHKKTIGFNNIPYTEVYAIYTYRGNVYCLKEGIDIPFDDLTEEEQKKIINLVKNGNYKVDNSVQ